MRRKNIKHALTAVVVCTAVQVSFGVAFAEPPSDPRACPGDRWIVKIPNQERIPIKPVCPAENLWTVRPLFRGGANGLQAPDLAQYCLYETTNPSAMVKGPSFNLRAKDCHLVAPLAAPGLMDQPGVAASLFRGFALNTGRLKKLPRGDSAPAEVRVAVVDSSPTGWFGGRAGQLGNFYHGRAVGRAVRELSCPDDGLQSQPCIGQVSNHLSMPYLPSGARDDLNGGSHGSIADLAVAIEAAVDDWLVQEPKSHLVINLSEGWDGIWGGRDIRKGASAADVSMESVYAAIQNASCLGALTVAAAGNQSVLHTNNPVQAGPMLPAAWETEPAPSLQRCRDVLGIQTGKVTPAGVFLISSGGVDGQDTPVVNTRPQGRPRLAAYAYGVAVTDPEHSALLGHTTPLTGTSMAAAVTSAVAAVVWGYDSSLSAASVVERLYKSGAPIPGSADYCTGVTTCPAGTPIHRVNLCSAIREACARAADRSACPAALPSCTLAAAGNPRFGDLNPATAALDATPGSVLVYSNAFRCATPDCGGWMLSRPASSYPWVVPLPSPTICLPCNLVTYKGSGSGLSLSADPFNVGVGKGEQPAMLMTRRAGSEWTQALLEVTTSSSTAGFLIPAQSAADVNLNLVKMLVGYPPGETVVTASIVFEVPDPLDPGHTFIREEPVYFDAPVTPVPLMRQSHLAALFGCFLLVGLGSLLVRKRSDRPFPPSN